VIEDSPFRLNLSRLDVHAQYAHSREQLKGLKSSLSIEQYEDYVMGTLISRLHGWILRGHPKNYIRAGVDVYVPTSWWQMFKRDVLPKWFAQRFPVKTRRERVETTVEQEVRVCPHIDIPWPPDNRQSIDVHFDFLSCGELSKYDKS
jgi:hypothetical protein